MVIKRSRQWVKERIPAFICRDSNWFVSRWIQCNVFLCPECRQEYKTLKSVWDELDAWEIEPEETLSEDKFSAHFRQQFPSAFDKMEEEAVTTTADWLPTFAFAAVAALLLLVVMQANGPRPTQTQVNHVTLPPQARAPQIESQTKETQVAEAPPQATTPKRNYNLRSRVVGYNQVPDDWEVYHSTMTPQTSVLSNSPAPALPRLGFDDLDRMGRTVEINNQPLVGFESLTAPYEEERPY